MTETEIIEKFEEKFGHLSKKGLRINGLAETNAEKRTKVISVAKPLVFDSRLIPKKFEGLSVKRTIYGDLPNEFGVDKQNKEWFKKNYIWAPERFEKYVDNNADEIKKQLGYNDMNRDEMLDALCFGDFEAHREKCDKMIKEGRIPTYSE
jgi:hypothetical protein